MAAQARWISGYHGGWVIVMVGCSLASLSHSAHCGFGPYTLHSAESTAWLGVWGKTQIFLPDKHSRNSDTRSSPDPSQVSFSTGPKNQPRGLVPTFLVGHRISEGAIQTSAWDILTASSASSTPSSYSEISLCLSQPTCHDNTASHCKFSSCCCSACSQFS